METWCITIDLVKTAGTNLISCPQLPRPITCSLLSRWLSPLHSCPLTLSFYSLYPPRSTFPSSFPAGGNRLEGQCWPASDRSSWLTARLPHLLPLTVSRKGAEVDRVTERKQTDGGVLRGFRRPRRRMEMKTVRKVGCEWNRCGRVESSYFSRQFWNSLQTLKSLDGLQLEVKRTEMKELGN